MSFCDEGFLGRYGTLQISISEKQDLNPCFVCMMHRHGAVVFVSCFVRLYLLVFWIMVGG